MRLICPNCTAQYEVAEGAIPENGRDVQCANCSHIWFQEPILFLDPVSKVETNLAPEYIPEPEPDLAPQHQPIPPETQHFQSLIRNEDKSAEQPQVDEFPDSDEKLPEFRSVFGANRQAPVQSQPETHAEPEPQIPPAPDAVEEPAAPSASSSVLEVLRNEAAYAADQTGADTPKSSDISFELPELDEPDANDDIDDTPQVRVADTEPDIIEEDTPVDLVNDVLTGEPSDDISDTEPSVSDDIDQEDDAISRMFDRISNTETPEDPTIGGDNSVSTFDATPEIDEPDVTLNSDDDDTLDAQSPDASEETESDLPSFVSTAAVAAGAKKTVDVASFIERLKSAEKTIERTPAESAYQAAQDAQIDADAMADQVTAQDAVVNAPAAPAIETTPDQDLNIAPENDVAPKKGKTAFRDVDEIEGEIRLGADQAEAVKIETDAANEKIDLDGENKTADTGGAFWNGFYAACIAVVLATLLYIMAPSVSKTIPATEATVNSYTAFVDTGRMHVQNLYTEGGEPSLSNFASNTWKAITGN
ncbi:hypothetical protein GCM10008927_22960 [Amylibacter ulvae]|uniref:Zinc finger/thioredoxin putative domain-containing protein n=1 Tax=Paramylibacter ulvae TaxID=1651968 RepID=A0ABQ3D4N6_9RHOB|nr:zinc-ribbon domain-containing protein [Amylibacter ulvae]GHA56575.1 hypothetical protein GCM10008927_22960 [Amylibacter ulvae]